MEQQQGSGAPEAPGAIAPAVAAPDVSATTETQEGTRSPQPERRDIPDVVKQRLASLARNESKYRREAAENKARADHLERMYGGGQQAGQAQPQQRQEPQFDPDQVMTQAREIAAFDLKCNQVAEAGKKVPGFGDAMSNLGMIGLSQDALAVIVEADDAAMVIAHLGSHLDEAAEIFAKPPAAMARAITKLEHTLTQQPAVSNAPNPLKALRGGGAAGGPAIGTKAWFDAQNKADAERRKR